MTSWNSGGEAAAQCSSAEVSLWVCVWGGVLLLKVPTQHHAKWNLRLKDPEQSRGSSEWLQDVQFYLTSHPYPENGEQGNHGEQGNLMEQGLLSSQPGLWTRKHAPTDTHTNSS